jgi:hypothetical protein
MEHPKDIGDRSTLAIMLALRDAGYHVLVPFGENIRYDLVIDDGQRLARVQCKTGRLLKGAVVFHTVSSYAHHPSPKSVKRDYLGDVDLFAVYCRQTTGIYLIPIEDLPVKAGSLRIDPPRNNQWKRVRFAADYEIARVSIAGLRAPSGA